MTAAPEVTERQTAPAPAGAPKTSVRVLRAVAWTLIGLGIVVVLYLVYSLFFTNLQTESSQRELMQTFRTQVDSAATAQEPSTTQEPPVEQTLEENPVVGEEPPAVPSGEAVAVMWFERPGAARPVTDEEYVVVSGVTLADLQKGPGHYPQTALPGAEGNFAVAGHRTTYGAPFFRLDELTEGDEIHVLDTNGTKFVYAFREQRIVQPTNLSVLAPQPLPDATSTITLTTCHPRFSNAQRLIVFGELVT